MPHHCQYNTKKLVCALVKCEVADRNTIFSLSDTEMSMNTATDITKMVWQSFVKHTENLQDKNLEANSYVTSWTQ
jgi:hypothetical protein